MTDGVPSLRRNFSWTFLGNAVYAACLWGMLAILTKLGSPDIVGRFALGSAIATPVIMFAGLQLRVVLVTDAKGTYEFRDFLGIRVALLPIAFLVVVVIAVMAYNPEQALVIGMFGLVRCAESLSDLFYGLAQKNERMDLMARSLWIRGVTALVLFGGVFWWTGSLALSLAANVVGWVMVIAFFDGPHVAHLVRAMGESGWRPRFDQENFRKIIWVALPLGVAMLLVILRNTIPRAVLEKYFGEDQLGIFSAMSYLVIAGSTVIMALSQSSVARLSRYFEEGRHAAFRATIIKLLGVGILIGVGGVLVAALFGPKLLEILYSREYALHNDLFVVIMIGGALLYLGSLLAAPINAMRNFRVHLWVYLANTILLAGLSWWLIPRHGMMGAAIVMVVCSAWVTVAYGFLVFAGVRRMADRPPEAPAAGKEMAP